MAVDADLRLPRGSQTDARLRCMGRRGRRGCAYLLRRLGAAGSLGAKCDKESDWSISSTTTMTTSVYRRQT